MQQTLSYRNSYQQRRRKRQQRIILALFILLLIASLVVGFFLYREIKKSAPNGDGSGQQEEVIPPDDSDPNGTEPDGSETDISNSGNTDNENTDADGVGGTGADGDNADGSAGRGKTADGRAGGGNASGDGTDGNNADDGNSNENGDGEKGADGNSSDDGGNSDDKKDADGATGTDSSDANPDGGESENPDFSLENTLFIGDSRTEGLLINTGLPDATVYAVRGLAVDNIYTKKFVPNGSGSKETIMDALKHNSFRKIYIMLGVNELGWAFDYLFIEQYATVIEDIKKLQPDAEIVIQSIIPVTAEKSRGDKIYNNPKIYEYNELIMQMAEEQDATYADLTPAFSDANGALPAEGSVDGVHLTKSYYEKWLDYLISQDY